MVRVSLRILGIGRGGDHDWDYDYGDGAAADSCYALDGARVDCWFGDYWWSPGYNMWCKVADEEFWDKYIFRRVDGTRDDSLILYRCTTPDRAPGEIDEIFWGRSSQPTVDPEMVIKEQVVSLGLHPPTVGVGAFVYPDARDWGLSWWVGAPMWLFVDADDPLQWGTHELSVSLEGVTMTATVQANRVSYDPGDGSAPVVCTNQGIERPFNDRELMRNHSPYGCEHIYMHTNVLGDKNSRYVVSAMVTWRVTWSATNGQSGAFSFDVASVESPAVHIGVVRVVDKIW